MIFELPLSYPDLVFTRKWGGNFITGTDGDCVQMVITGTNGEYAQTMTIGSDGYILDFCYDFMQMLYSVGDRMVLRFIF